MSWQLWEVTETKFSAGLSCVIGPAELIEMVQYPKVDLLLVAIAVHGMYESWFFKSHHNLNKFLVMGRGNPMVNSG